MAEVDKYTRIDKSRACLILGALGDALGAPVEFMKREEIIAKYGDDPDGVKGIRTLDVAYGKKGAVTDDTQMTLFAADGLIGAYKRGAERGILADFWGYTAMSYIKWLETQGMSNPNYTDLQWGNPKLFELVKAQGQRGPGNTCVSALKAMSRPAKPAENDSKGCGTVMRVAPVGIFFGNLYATEQPTKEVLQKVYDEGVNDAAITHGNTTAHHASGLLAVIVALCLNGKDLSQAVNTALEYFGTEDVTSLCQKAVQLASQSASVENLQSLGQGWVAEEALTIGLYCALLCTNKTLTVKEALALAVNHDGDSDSTGAITGNLVGIALGTEVISQDLIGSDTEVGSMIELLRKYGEDLLEIADYKTNP